MGVQTPIMACAFTVPLRPQPTRRTSWKLVGNLLETSWKPGLPTWVGNLFPTSSPSGLRPLVTALTDLYHGILTLA